MRFRASRPVLLCLLATAVLTVAFGWIGSRLVQHEEAIAAQQLQQRLDAAADLAAAALVRQHAELASQLAALAVAPRADLQSAARKLGARLSADTRLVVVDNGSVDVFPEGGLPYYPPPPPDDLQDGVFAVADAYEFTGRDPARAVRVLRTLAADDDVRVRAGALLRLGRNLQKLAARADALAAYEKLAALGATRVGGLPSELVARYARAMLFEKIQDQARLREEARALEADLRRGRWRIDRSAYLFYSQTAQRWLRLPEAFLDGQQAAPAVEERQRVEGPVLSERTRVEGLAAAIDLLWTEWPQIQRGEREQAGVRITGDGDDAVMMMWHSAPSRLTAIVAAAPRIEREWLAPIRSAAERQRVHLELVTNHSRATPPGVARTGVVRATSDTGLPWTLRVASADPAAEASELAARRRLIVGGLALVGVVLLASTYSIGRAVNRELRAARLQSEFVAAVSHEFRSPLTSMRQVTELLAGGRVAGEERRGTYYALLARESLRLQRLVESLLDFGRTEAGMREYRRAPMNLARVLRDTVAEFQLDASERGYEVALTGCDGDLPVRADEEAIRRALWNLLDNAVKYSPDCRTVWVRVTADAGHATIDVQDRGAGIARDEQKAIFAKFVRGTAARATGAAGTGLGLAMVRHIVEGHGGAIGVSSAPGGGSTFTITLPIEEHS